jgi:hypothetical protein
MRLFDGGLLVQPYELFFDRCDLVADHLFDPGLEIRISGRLCRRFVRFPGAISFALCLPDSVKLPPQLGAPPSSLRRLSMSASALVSSTNRASSNARGLQASL